jgi:hypothetical protein
MPEILRRARDRLTTRRVWYGVRPHPHLPAQSFTRYKEALVLRRFSNNSLPLFCSLPLSHLPAPPPHASGPLTPLPGPLVPTEPIRRGQWEICRCATADSYSLDASAALSRRLGHATALDAGLPPSSVVHQPITSPVSIVADQDRVSTLTGCVITALPLRRPVTNLHRGWVWSSE